ncbi:hypothetical protein BDN72DRAFT_853252 [Pluteus cervinus]|uniref:Uncharacterized protein n=1 Tax=Pluteus cervinus TaxID=181527 RepID=A0ACD3BB94_9AGAR|nr:hypothetical protein BDN72DRAFT_853252 [Pluteus cervinus]
MSENPSTYEREAKENHQSLKALLKSRDPFDKEVEFHRKNLRKQYLSLLILHPNAPESNDVETHLWMQTSYAIISSYKERLSTLDKAIQQNMQQQQGQPPAKAPAKQNHHGPVEHRKLVQRFRQFLAEEEKFWTMLLLRMCQLFQLDEVRPALKEVNILLNVDDPLVGPSDGVGSATMGRNQFQFPPEDSVPAVDVQSIPREKRLARITKTLVYLGDIARYRELYNDARGKPRPGHNDTIPAKKKRGRGLAPGMENIARPRNYERARLFYEQAKILMPTDGNASHQLAILATYEPKSNFLALVHYYRALCVSQPYHPAGENLNLTLVRALRPKNEKRKAGPKDQQASAWRIDAFQEKVVVLHALWRMGLADGIEKMEATSPQHRQHVYADFLALLSERHLPMPLIMNTMVLAQGVLWKHRMFNDPGCNNSSREAVLIESEMFLHLLDVYRALLEVGIHELKEPIPLDSGGDLAQRITATFRRTLESLRVAGKWLRANSKYMQQDPEFLAYQAKESHSNRKAAKDKPSQLSVHSAETIAFWESYAEFVRLLSSVYPFGQLPEMAARLDEDVELRGFRPLNQLLEVANNANFPEQHPNEEQLMRIRDILQDANILLDIPNSPLERNGSSIVARVLSTIKSSGRPSYQQSLPPPPRLSLAHSNRQEDDAMTEETSRTDDDVLREAFEHLNSPDRDMDDEQIVWDPRANASPPTVAPILPSSPPKIQPMTPVRVPRSPVNTSPRSPTASRNPPADTFSPLTARDLLDNVMGLRGPSKPPRPMQSKPALFAPDSLHGSASIWAPASDEALRHNHSHTYASPTRAGLSSFSQDPWSAPLSPGTQNSQQTLPALPPSSPYTMPPHNVVNGHHRVPSVSSQLFSGFNQGQVSPNGYGFSATIQPPIQRPDVTSFSPPLGVIGQRTMSGFAGHHMRHASLQAPRTQHSQWATHG